MPREARLESAGAVYHLLDRSRGRDEDWRDSQTDPYSYSPVNISGTVANVTANALNQYTQVKGVIPQYDGNFNLKVYGAFGFNYDAEKRLTSASKSGVIQVECTYDGLGRVVRRIEQGVTTLYTYDEWKPIVEWDGSGTMVAWNVYGAGADEILWRWRVGVGYLRYHADRMGNVTSVLDFAGNLTEQYSYDAYGMPTILSANNTQLLTSAIGNRFMFTGREYLSSIAAYDYRHRMYRPNIGRFLQSDPIGFDAGDMNLFRYCGYDPVDRSDPTGLEDIDISSEWNRLGIQASLNSRAASIASRDGMDRSQLIVERHGRLSLQKGFTVGETRTEHVWGRVLPLTIQTESGTLNKGERGKGSGHVHMDRTGRPRAHDPNWSKTDWATATGSKDHPGQPVWKVLESDASRVGRLTPQKKSGDRATEQMFQANQGNQGTNTDSSPGQSTSSSLTAGDVDALHQGTGVPSLGAEAVNLVRGPR